MKLLNLGCGSRFRRGWANMDLAPVSNEVLGYDLAEGIPWPDSSFDFVYHSHFLEHLARENARAFLRECFRVLRPKGVMRVVVPDLEQIARTYIEALEGALNGSSEWADNYHWILLEMYDQAVREKAGGEMLVYLQRDEVPNRLFVVERCGVEVERVLRKDRGRDGPRGSESHRDQLDLRGVRRKISDLVVKTRDRLLKVLLFGDHEAFEIGRFRQKGEVHKWMYDRYSLLLLLRECGFVDVVQRSAVESYLENWARWDLDTESDGRVYKPDSLYMEGMKPTG